MRCRVCRQTMRLCASVKHACMKLFPVHCLVQRIRQYIERIEIVLIALSSAIDHLAIDLKCDDEVVGVFLPSAKGSLLKSFVVLLIYNRGHLEGSTATMCTAESLGLPINPTKKVRHTCVQRA